MAAGKKKALLALAAAACAVLLTGCSFSDLMSWGSGLRQDPDYQTWERLSEKGKLDKDGKYTADAVHVTFAENSYLDAHYYSDPEMKNELPAENCYLLPGDVIYCSAVQMRSLAGFYDFERLLVMDYGTDGERLGYLSWPEGDTPNSVMIPYDYKGTEVSIEPTGRFGKRVMVLSDAVGENSVPVGTWKVNGERAAAGKTEIDPLETVTVEYKYDPNSYYVISCSPEYWKADFDDGLVVFGRSEPKTGEEKYEIVLERYLKASVSVGNGTIYSAELGEDKIAAGKEKKLTVPKIRQGSTVILVTDVSNKKDIMVECELKYKIKDSELIPENGDTRFRYQIEFGDADRFMFIPSEYAPEHGKLRFMVNGREITERIQLSTGMEIAYEAAETEDGYWLPQGGGTVAVKGSETAASLKEIRFYPYRQVTVLLDRPKAGGRIVYTLDGRELDGGSVDAYCGSVIRIRMENANGWESKAGNEASYIVTESAGQLVDINGLPASGVFRELESHKPALTVEINQNAAPAKTTVEASGISGYKDIEAGKADNILATYKTVISKEKIGTDGDIRFIFSDLDLSDGCNALEVTVEKETKAGPFREVHYAQTANTPIVIKLWEDREYVSVSVRIDAVRAESFIPIELENAEFTAAFTDVIPDGAGNDSISRGDPVSDDRGIEITVRPHEGYFMAGKDTKDDVYSKKTEYKDYRRMDGASLQEQLKKECVVTFITEDPYGKVEYLVDGKPVEGTVKIREDKEVVCRYELTDDKYEIIAERSLLEQARNLVDGSVYRKIEIGKTVTRGAFDGMEISREDFVEVREKVSE